MEHKDRSPHDIIEGTIFRFYPGQNIVQHSNEEGDFRYLYRGNRYDAVKGEFDERLLAYMGFRRVEETKTPRTRNNKKPRRNHFRLRPAFILDGRLVFIETFDMVFPNPGQQVYRDDD